MELYLNVKIRSTEDVSPSQKMLTCEDSQFQRGADGGRKGETVQGGKSGGVGLC